jgi:hypothetical protein
MAIDHRLQIKYNQVQAKYQGYFNKPVYKFYRQMVYGILKSGHVHVSKIAKSLNENIALKKTWERLSRHLGRSGLCLEILSAHARENRRAFRAKQFWVLDLTDIRKMYAKAMEGLGRIHDGSTGESGNGYWVVNVAGVSPSSDSISLMYSELYSLEHEQEKKESENSKIISAVEWLRAHLGVTRPVVIDRGGDRRVLIENFLQHKQEFIIRQRGDRFIFDGQKNIIMTEYAKQIDCQFKKTVSKIRHGKPQLTTYRGGASRVWFPKQTSDGHFSTALWLVRLTRKNGKAESWYLCDIPAQTEEEAFEMVMQGYGCRWTIEEVHRQIKTDYHLEGVQLQRYRALKNFNTIFWTAMNFIYQHLEGLSVDLIIDSDEKLSYKYSIYDITGFVYYKLARAVQLIFRKHKLNSFIDKAPPKSRDQLNLALE